MLEDCDPGPRVDSDFFITQFSSKRGFTPEPEVMGARPPRGWTVAAMRPDEVDADKGMETTLVYEAPDGRKFKNLLDVKKALEGLAGGGQVLGELEDVGKKMKHLAKLDYAHSLQQQCESALLGGAAKEGRGGVVGEGAGGKRRAKVTIRGGEEIECDAVLCTAPLGILQKGYIKWEPELPQWKTKAMDRIGNGLINKVFLKFEAPFWDTQYDFFGRTSDDPK